MSISFNEFWSSSNHKNPPLTDMIINKAESMLGIKLPSVFLDLLKIQNGGYTNGFAFPMNIQTTWADDHVPLDELFGIVLDGESDSFHNIMDSGYLIQEWGLPSNQVLLTGDGHWWITLDYRQSDVPSIRWIDCECDEDILVADSFDTFINGLVRAENYL